jgi:hypothetical protein
MNLIFVCFFFSNKYFSVCTNLESKLTTVKDKEIDLDDELRKAKECSIETDKRFQEVKLFLI